MQTQRAGTGSERGFKWRQSPLFEAREVIGADTGEQRQLFRRKLATRRASPTASGNPTCVGSS
jgi:hypothetical protein